MKIVRWAYEFVADGIPVVCGMVFMLIGVGSLGSDSMVVFLISLACVVGGLWMIREGIRKEERRKATEWLGTITGKVASNVAIVLTSDEEGCTRRVKIWRDSEPPDDLAKDEAA